MFNFAFVTQQHSEKNHPSRRAKNASWAVTESDRYQHPRMVFIILLVLATLSLNSAAGPAAVQLQTLRQKINHYDALYYLQGTSGISDREYDALKQRLLELESQYPDLQGTVSGKPSTSVLQERPTGRHLAPMGGLRKCYSPEDWSAEAAKLEKISGNQPVACSLEPKIDGVAISLRYEQGTLVQALTRGDGQTGNDVTPNVRTIPGIPTRLPTTTPPDICEIRGEIFISKSQFTQLNQRRLQQKLPVFANARDAAAGSILLLDSSQADQRPLTAIFYGHGQFTPPTPENQTALLAQLRAWGFPTIASTEATTATALPEILRLLKHRDDLPYEIDGIVVKVSDFRLRQRLGFNGRAPAWAVAYKFYSDSAITRLRDISIQVGRTGVLTPVAILDPVQLDGSIVRKASLHNFRHLAKCDIRIDDLLEITKAGRIIPQVERVLPQPTTTRQAQFTPPECCPACGCPTKQEGNNLYCTNPECPAQLQAALCYFAGRKAMNIRSLGPALAKILIESGLVSSPADLYTLTPANYRQLERIKGIGPAKLRTLRIQLEASKQLPSWRWLTAMGIPNIGPATAKRLMEHFPSLSDLAKADIQTLQKIPGIGPASAQNLHRFFHDPLKSRALPVATSE
jgi:DNA ligase (NAD+)